MKKTLSVLLLFISSFALAQNPSPQPNFSTQVLAADPSLYLNFNDTTTAFRDSVSGDLFTNTGNPGGSSCQEYPTSTGALSCALTVTAGDTILIGVQYSASSITSVTDSLGGTGTLLKSQAWSSGTNVTALYYIPNVVAGSSTITVNFAATTAYPSVTVMDVPGAITSSPIDQSTIGVGDSATLSSGAITTTAANETLVGMAVGYGVSSIFTQTSPNFGYGTSTSNQIGAFLFAPTIGTYSYNATASVSTKWSDLVVSVKLATVPTFVVPRQPGFDSTTPDNTSAEFPYNGWNVAPNTTLGSIDWNVPWSMMVQLDHLNWDRKGTLVLASKGDSSSTSNSWWKLYLQMNGNYSEVCFARNGDGSAIGTWGGMIGDSVCTASNLDVAPNGFNYNIIVQDAGTGQPSSLSLYVNGLDGTYIGGLASTSSYQYSFGAVAITVGGAGTGYAATTPFTSTGGGPNCVVTGTMAAVSGVPTAGEDGIIYTVDAGCTSPPTIVLTSPTGIGVSLTAALNGASMNSTAYPLMVPGYVSANSYNGIDPTDSMQAPTYIDEFALFPGNLTSTQIQSLYYHTKFYQGLIKALPAIPYALVYDDDSCDDEDNLFALSLAIAAQRIGYIQLAGVVDSEGDGVSEAVYRQMLDQAGLASVPVSVPSVFGSSTTGGWCSAANVSTFNASTAPTTSSYPQAKTMYRQVFANNPTTPVFIMLGGSFRGVADLMQSPADSISPLTGAQMIAQNAANGGAIYAQGLGANETFSGDNSLQDWTAGQYVVENNGAMPIYWYGGEPQNTGPGVLSTRTSKDPFFLAATTLGTDVRPGYDSLLTQSFISNLFAGGVNVAISGAGTGYAAQTAFTSTGGGANCVVTGFMLSTKGVPSSILSTGGIASTGTYEGVGSGCFTASNPPTIVLTNPTGTGAVLTATTTASACGTVTITSATSGSTTTATCSNHYFLPMSLNAMTSSAPIMEWFLNSLIDPDPSGVPRRNE